ncbi:acyltransferase family protein [Spirosoma litoris]
MQTSTQPERPSVVKKIFFPNLDGVRAIAATLVVMSHIELHKPLYGIERFETVNFLDLGKIGVCIFFVLSGFLITYLLLEERKSFHKINYRDFYTRRVLRIWPLYFIVLLIGYFIYPKFDNPTGFWLSVFFLPNVAFILKMLPAVIDPVWSIGVEEQFYIFQPHLLRIKKMRALFYVVAAFIVALVLIRAGLNYFKNVGAISPVWWEFLFKSRFDSMLLGALLALLFFDRSSSQLNMGFLQRILFQKSTQIIALVSMVSYVLAIIFFSLPVYYEFISLLSGVIIINICSTESSVISLQAKPFLQLGKVSYGIYLLHKFPVMLALYLTAEYLPRFNKLTDNLFIYLFVPALTFILASLSYNYIESYFLKLKKRFGHFSKD